MWNPLFRAGVPCSQGFTGAYRPFECWEDDSVFRKQLISTPCASLKTSASLSAAGGSFPALARLLPWPVQDTLLLLHSSAAGALPSNFRWAWSAQGWGLALLQYLNLSIWIISLLVLHFWVWTVLEPMSLNSLSFPWQKVGGCVLSAVHGDCNADGTGGAAPPQLFCVRWAPIWMSKRINCRICEGPSLFLGLVCCIHTRVMSFRWGMGFLHLSSEGFSGFLVFILGFARSHLWSVLGLTCGLRSESNVKCWVNVEDIRKAISLVMLPEFLYLVRLMALLFAACLKCKNELNQITERCILPCS